MSEREGLDAEFPPHPAAPSCACPRCTPNPYTDPLAPYERPYLRELRVICEAVGYGRVQQVVKDWYEEKCPGWKAASDAVAAKKALETRRWLALLTDREAKLSAVRELAAYRDVGCMSGDCPHDTQAQCNASLAAEYAEFLKDIAVHTKETQ